MKPATALWSPPSSTPSSPYRPMLGTSRASSTTPSMSAAQAKYSTSRSRTHAAASSPTLFRCPSRKNGCLVGNKVMTPCLGRRKERRPFHCLRRGLQRHPTGGLQPLGPAGIHREGLPERLGRHLSRRSRQVPARRDVLLDFQFRPPTGRVQRKDYVTILRGGE